MKRLYSPVAILLLLFFTACQTAVWAAPAKPVSLGKVRYSQTQDKVRIVFDVDALPEYKVSHKENPAQIIIDFANTVNKDGVKQTSLNDPVVSSVKVLEPEAKKQRVVIDLKNDTMYKVFTLKNPNRVVVDIIRSYNQKFQEEIVPGVQYTYWSRGTKDGPVAMYMVDAAPRSGYSLNPVLSNSMISGLDTLRNMAEESKAIAAVNASYFGKDGSIIGMLKIKGEIVSTPEIARTALGVMPDGTLFIDQVDYKGMVTLPDGKAVAITAVNCERTENGLVLYNSYYGFSTGSNDYGTEYEIRGGKVTAIFPKKGNVTIAPDALILSAHGTAEKALEGLKEGDAVTIKQALGKPWDDALHIVGAGPTLVKNGSVYLTSKLEEFASDIAVGRAPRTAVGLTKEGHVLLVVVDGRQSHSIGMTLLELALFMQEQGAVHAMNLDGGGSSEMVIKGKVMNKPSDGRERKVGNALALVPDKLVN